MIEVLEKEIGINFHKMNLNTRAESGESTEDKKNRKENNMVKKINKNKNKNKNKNPQLTAFSKLGVCLMTNHFF